VKHRAVIYSPEAADDLDWIYNTIATASSPITADRYDRRIREFCERLEYGSQRGTRRDDLLPDFASSVLSVASPSPLSSNPNVSQFCACSMAVPTGKKSWPPTSTEHRCNHYGAAAGLSAPSHRCGSAPRSSTGLDSWATRAIRCLDCAMCRPALPGGCVAWRWAIGRQTYHGRRSSAWPVVAQMLK
jgi:plasmid stabilization system protein ParE